MKCENGKLHNNKIYTGISTSSFPDQKYGVVFNYGPRGARGQVDYFNAASLLDAGQQVERKIRSKREKGYQTVFERFSFSCPVSHEEQAFLILESLEKALLKKQQPLIRKLEEYAKDFSGNDQRSRPAKAKSSVLLLSRFQVEVRSETYAKAIEENLLSFPHAFHHKGALVINLPLKVASEVKANYKPDASVLQVESALSKEALEIFCGLWDPFDPNCLESPQAALEASLLLS